MPAPEIIIQLVEKFERNRDAYRSGRYNEVLPHHPHRAGAARLSDKRHPLSD